MKKFVLGFLCCIELCNVVVAQDAKPKTIGNTQEEEIPLVLKFEPKLLSKADTQRQLFLMERIRIDTLPISDKRKQKRIRNLYKDVRSGTFSATQVTETVFENED